MKYAGNKCDRVKKKEISKNISKKCIIVKLLNVFRKNPGRGILGTMELQRSVWENLFWISSSGTLGPGAMVPTVPSL